jgi:hypothetical protein
MGGGNCRCRAGQQGRGRGSDGDEQLGRGFAGEGGQGGAAGHINNYSKNAVRIELGDLPDIEAGLGTVIGTKR